MMVGIDVCHDKMVSSGFVQQQTKQVMRDASTVGFIASYDQHFSAFHGSIAFQGRYEEYVRTSRELMKRNLEAYKVKNRAYPASVLIFRDGVGDSQLKVFVDEEIKVHAHTRFLSRDSVSCCMCRIDFTRTHCDYYCVVCSLQEFEQSFRDLAISPKLTVVVVQKRLSARLFEKNTDGRGGAFKSPTPGTVVDTQITSAILWDYFLVPCTAPPGASARPTRFIVLRDDIRFTADQIEELSMRCCCFYVNWNGPVRVPHVAMYAHKMAYLFGKYIRGNPHPALGDKLFYL